VFIGIDAPDFNFGLEARLKTAGIPTVHFVSPSFWAWRAGKLAKLKASADHVLCIFPFEPPLLAQHGIAATYVGHPLASVIPLEPDRRRPRGAGPAADGPVVALLPGSRESEIRYIATRFLPLRPDPAASGRPRASCCRPCRRCAALVEQAAQAMAWATGCRSSPASRTRVLAACDVTLIASGTATLEAALFKRPMVIAYNMNWLSWQRMRASNLQPWVGLPNILCREFVVPELLQDAATPAGAGRAVLAGWTTLPPPLRLQQRFAALHHNCGATPRTGHRCDRASPCALNRPAGLGRPRPGGRGGRGRPRAAGRPGGGGRRDPGRPEPDPRPGRLQEAHRRAGARRAVRRNPRQGAVLLDCRGQRGRDRPLNILQATLLAMQRAVEGLRLKPAKVLVDGNRLPVLDVLAEAIVKGDARCRRSRRHRSWPRCTATAGARATTSSTPIRLCGHKGYGTAEHLAALREHGACPEHRRSFSPVRGGAGMSTQPALITSRDNPFSRRCAAWRRTAWRYRKQGQVWLEGDHLCRAALQRGLRRRRPCFLNLFGPSQRVRLVIGSYQKHSYLPDRAVCRGQRAGIPAHMGFVMDLPLGHALLPDVPTVVLDRVQDAGNVGSILRSAGAFGFRQVRGAQGDGSAVVAQGAAGRHGRPFRPAPDRRGGGRSAGCPRRAPGGDQFPPGRIPARAHLPISVRMGVGP
jgi:lipid-A-disaccharide synthase